MRDPGRRILPGSLCTVYGHRDAWASLEMGDLRTNGTFKPNEPILIIAVGPFSDVLNVEAGWVYAIQGMITGWLSIKALS